MHYVIAFALLAGLGTYGVCCAAISISRSYAKAQEAIIWAQTLGNEDSE